MTPDDDKPLTAAQARQKLQKGLLDYLSGKSTGPIVFRLKRTKKANETYSLKLTQQQRETLLQLTQLSRNLKIKIVPVTWNELHKLNDETGKVAYYARSLHKKRLMAVMDKVVKFFEEEHKEVFGVQEPKTRKRRPTNSDLLYQFKITLLESNPPIWRRIQVQDCTLDKLHEHIQTAMGWTNSHLHQFEIDDKHYADPDLWEAEFELVDSTTTMLSDIIPAGGKKFQFKYEYDFGDDWEHEVLYEGCPVPGRGTKYPVCLEGEHACPPEDVGRIWGYVDFLEALSDPKHEEHENMLEWIGGKFDPLAFDAKQATKEMKKGLPDWRSMR